MSKNYSDQYCEEVLASHGVRSPDEALIWRDDLNGGSLILIKAKAPGKGVSGLIVEVEEENLALVRYLRAQGTMETSDPAIFQPVSPGGI